MCPAGGHEFLYKGVSAQRKHLRGKQLTRAILLSLALCGGMTFMGAGTVYAGDNSTISHDESTKTTTVSTGSEDHSIYYVYGNASDTSGTTYTTTPTAEGYTVNMSDGKVYEVYGGHAYFVSSDDAVTATSNTVNISGGTVSQCLYGGWAQSSSGVATASSNTVTQDQREEQLLRRPCLPI